ncbi:MAG: UDP-2,3-diacylglucosamine diphosphatase [Chitinophagales bacterium]
MPKRKVDILVISDLHLGTYGSRAKRLLHYLKTVEPKTLILNGDIMDFWLLDMKKWPKSHSIVLQHFFNEIARGIDVYYVTGNHDDYLRSFTGFKFNNFKLVDEIVLNLNGKITWFTHGDKFDKSVSGAIRNMAIRAGKIFDQMIRFNKYVNQWQKFFGITPSNYTKNLKDKTKVVVKKQNDFELQNIEYADENGYDVVICGHTHNPGKWEYDSRNKDGEKIVYYNSGDWMDNCTALEYNNGEWDLIRFKPKDNSIKNFLKNLDIDKDEIL